MSTRNHLKRIATILWQNFDDEIKEHGDWFYATKHWEINFTYEPDFESIVAYKRDDCDTDWSNSITLEKRKKVWEVMV